VGQAIREEGVMSEKTEGALRKAIDFYGSTFGGGEAASSASSSEEA